VSVIVPTYNRARYVTQSLDSILAQTLPPAQVIVVDDGSTDATARVLEPYLDRITYLAKDNEGKPSAVNAGLAVADGEYVWVFDDDDVACPDALERHVGVLEGRPDVGFTYSNACACIEDERDGTLRESHVMAVRDFPEDELLVELLLSGFTASPAVVVRRSVQEAAGGYDGSLVRCEDWDMSIRWALLAPGCRVPEARPTYLRRIHHGARGPRARQIPYSEDVLTTRVFDRHILRDVRHDLELWHYLPRSEWGRPLGSKAERRARCRRFAVRFAKGLWPEALEDLEAVRVLSRQRHPFADDELRFFRRAGGANVWGVVDFLGSGHRAQVGRNLGAVEMRPLTLAFLRGLYYQLRSRTGRTPGPRLPRMKCLAALALGAGSLLRGGIVGGMGWVAKPRAGQ
jgi:glycosyltransferase involved in cell wall biosynthesis